MIVERDTAEGNTLRIVYVEEVDPDGTTVAAIISIWRMSRRRS
jgi:hypothetical protein